MSKLAHLPVGLFGAAMSLAALCGAWRLAHVMWVTPIFISEAIGALAVIAFIAMVTAYALKMTRHPARALAEFRHPVQGPLFATFFIALLLLPIVLYPYMLGFAQAMWCVGAALMLGFTTLIVHRWLNQQQGIDHPTPTWFVPVIGILNIPAAGFFRDVPAVRELGLLAVGIGLVFALVLFTLVFARLVLRPALPAPLVPTLGILIAPFAVGFVGYTGAIGEVDRLASYLFYVGLFMAVVMAPRLIRQAWRGPFRTSWWAVSFPLAALAVAALRYAEARPLPILQGLAAVILGLVSLVLLWLVVESLIHILRGDLLNPDIEAAAQAEAAR
ncbi:MAG TPA: SLAC1 anion channel family protein [Stellaceae bacterium]|nr:SLAC1 anion channel family protein [Stellaceae bacterium]